MAGLACVVGYLLHQRTRNRKQLLKWLMLVRYFEQLQSELVTLFGPHFADVTALLETNQHPEEFTDAAAEPACDLSAGQCFRAKRKQFQDVESLLQCRSGVAGLIACFLNGTSESARSGHSSIGYYKVSLIKTVFHI
jgi:hypothetical protein